MINTYYSANVKDAVSRNEAAPKIAFKQCEKIRTYDTAQRVYTAIIRKIQKDAQRYGGPYSYDWRTLFWCVPHYWVVMQWCVRVMRWCNNDKFLQDFNNSRQLH